MIDTQYGTRISQRDLNKRSHHCWRKKLSTCRENDTTTNEDIAMTSSMSITDQGREGELEDEREAKRKKGKGSTGEIDSVTW